MYAESPLITAASQTWGNPNRNTIQDKNKSTEIPRENEPIDCEFVTKYRQSE